MLYLVTGGSGSGKSGYAEALLQHSDCTFRFYLATMMVWDEEGKKRVTRHRAMRADKGFVTEERFTDLAGFRLPESGADSAVLLECMANLLSNEYYRLGTDAAEVVLKGINRLQKQCGDLIIVTNEVFSDGEDYGRETGEYIEMLGTVNRELARMAGSVTEVVYGIPLKIK